MKKIIGFEFRDFCEWCHKWGRFLAILAEVTWSWGQFSKGKYFSQVFIGN